jgi:CRP/FNR family cyclic AMP-dependent transcriptional regulator
MEASGGTFMGLLDDESRAAVATLGRQRSYRRGAVLLLEGDRSDHVFIIREGRIKVVATTAGGQDLLLAVRGPGELVGELAALTNGTEPRTASMVALDPIVAQVITGPDFVAFLEERPRVLMIVLRKIMERLRDADRRRIEFGSQHTMGRVAGYLAEMAERHGRPLDNGIEIGVALSQEELAGYIVASRESVARALMTLRRRGLITTGRRSVVVLDLDGLRTYRD